MAQDAQYGSQRFLTLTLGNELFAIDIFSVREILDYTDITRIPQTPEYMRGVVNVRGSAVPVVDLRMKFGLGQVERIMVFDLAGYEHVGACGKRGAARGARRTRAGDDAADRAVEASPYARRAAEHAGAARRKLAERHLLGGSAQLAVALLGTPGLRLHHAAQGFGLGFGGGDAAVG